MARIKHSQPNGKLERVHLEIVCHLESFEVEFASHTVRGATPGEHVGSSFHAADMTDPIIRLVDWYNNLLHISLMDGKETPVEAYERKQAPKDTTKEEMESELHAKS